MSEALVSGNGGAVVAHGAGADLGISLHPIVQAVLTQNPSIETLRDLMQLQKEWDAENARKAFTAALTAAKAEMTTVIGKDKTVDYTSKTTRERTLYKHVSLAAVVDAATVALAKHGLSLSWEAESDKGAVIVAAVLTHTGGHTMKSKPLSAPPDESGRKSKAQAVASTTTLLSRYTAMALLGLASGDMDEPQGLDAPGSSPRESTPENQAASKGLDDALASFAAAKDAGALRAAWKVAAVLPDAQRARAWDAWTKHAKRLGLEPKKPAAKAAADEPPPPTDADAWPGDEERQPGSDG